MRALFVIGRPLASAEAITRMTEALFGDYIGERAYRARPKHGRIPIVPDAAGNNTVLVDVWEHADPRAELVRRQVTEAALLQAVGRARAGLRGADDPLDVHLWTDVPLPELGPVEPVLWGELEGGLDALMMATGGVWLESVPHAAKAYPELFTAETLKKARTRAEARSGDGAGEAVRGQTIIRYRRAGAGQMPAVAVSLMGAEATKEWLEARLGSLPFYATMQPKTPGTLFGRESVADDADGPGAHAVDGAATVAALQRALATYNKPKPDAVTQMLERGLVTPMAARTPPSCIPICSGRPLPPSKPITAPG